MKNPGYRLGRFLGGVISLCITALVVAATIKLIMMIF